MLFPGKDYFLLLSVFPSCQELFVHGGGLICFPPFHVSMTVCGGLVQLMFRQPCWWDFTAVASDISRRQSNSKLLILLVLSVFPPPCPQDLWDLGAMYLGVLVETMFHMSAFWSVTVFCNGVCLWQRKVCLMRGLAVFLYLFQSLDTPTSPSLENISEFWGSPESVSTLLFQEAEKRQLFKFKFNCWRI